MNDRDSPAAPQGAQKWEGRTEQRPCLCVCVCVGGTPRDRLAALLQHRPPRAAGVARLVPPQVQRGSWTDSLGQGVWYHRQPKKRSFGGESVVQQDWNRRFPVIGRGGQVQQMFLQDTPGADLGRRWEEAPDAAFPGAGGAMASVPPASGSWDFPTALEPQWFCSRCIFQ